MQQHSGGEVKELPATQCRVGGAGIRDKLEPCAECSEQGAAHLHRHALQCEDASA